MKDLSEYDVSHATHVLKCRHQIGRNGYNYTMPCIILGRTKSRLLKIVVFGERNRAHSEQIKKLRYMPPWRITKSPTK